jgi:hypothetical protein
MNKQLVDITELKDGLQRILARENITSQRAVITELNLESVDCAAALLYLLQSGQSINEVARPPVLMIIKPQHIKMVRYRLAVGSKHRLNVELLKQVLIEESGVDKNNINNINIRDQYTLIDLPDEMPPDIFQHLKSVEINQHKLDIRRVKNRNNKKRNNNRYRHEQTNTKNSEQVA